MSTVLPTPAPPNRPILPPFRYGASRSTTLMPVTRISAEVACSSKVGASRWIGMRLTAVTGPCSSIGSPMTLRMRPRVPGPTGTLIGPPVSTTSCPRTMPSVLSMAMQRTVRSPSSCATSSTSVRLSILQVSAFWMNGSSPGNCTSTTAPNTCVTRPTTLLAMLCGPSRCGSERLGARDDLDQFACDVGLAGPVVVQGQPLDHVARVTRRVIHRGHARAVLTGGALQQRRIDLHRQRPRQQAVEDGFFIRLELRQCGGGVIAGRILRRRHRDQLQFCHDLRDH